MVIRMSQGHFKYVASDRVMSRFPQNTIGFLLPVSDKPGRIFHRIMEMAYFFQETCITKFTKSAKSLGLQSRPILSYWEICPEGGHMASNGE